MNKELTVEYIPSLIVAKDINGLYIPVGNADKHNEYYCPVCNNIVKPRALNSKKEQPHYYHVDNECSKESQLHWLYKNWLLTKGTEIIIGDKTYVIKECIVEPNIETKFGVYNPDLKIITTNDEIFYFEMKYSNGKDQTYCDKWDALKANVVEVDIKELINSNSCSVLPKFNYIYTNGKYTKEYEKREKKDKYISFKENVKYNNNLRLVNELNWFWNEFQNYNIQNFYACIENMDYDTLVDCTRWLKKIKCQDKYLECEKVCKKRLYEEILNNIPNSEQWVLSITRETTKRSCFTFKTNVSEFSEQSKYNFNVTTKTTDGLIKISEIDKSKFDDAINHISNYNSIIECHKEITNIVAEIKDKVELLYSVEQNLPHITILFLASNGEDWINVCDMVLNKNTVKYIKNNYINFQNKADEILDNNKKFNEFIKDLKDKVKIYDKSLKRINKEYSCYLDWNRRSSRKSGKNWFEPKIVIQTEKHFYSYDTNNYLEINNFMGMYAEILHGKYTEEKEDNLPIVDLVNKCKNKMWSMSKNYLSDYYELKLRYNGQPVTSRFIKFNSSDTIEDVKEKIRINMIEMISNKTYNDIRYYLEVNDEK